MRQVPRIGRWVALAAVLAHGGAAGASPCTTLEPARWLLGEWTAVDGKREVRESWRAASAATFEGQGLTRSRGDGRLLDGEALRLVAMADQVFYVAKVAHNEYPVAFRLIECDADRLVFANPAHDFPRRIEYRRTGPDAFEAHVSDGATKVFRLDFRREPGG